MFIVIGPTQPQSTLEDPDVVYPTVKIEHPHDTLDVDQIWEYLLKPALMAYGFNASDLEDISLTYDLDDEEEDAVSSEG